MLAFLILAQVIMLILVIIFATVHSGMASLRDAGEKLMGDRAYRVLFAGISLPLAVITVVSCLLALIFIFFIMWYTVIAVFSKKKCHCHPQSHSRV